MGWYPHPESNRDQRFRKPPLYPFELWGHKLTTNNSRRSRRPGNRILYPKPVTHTPLAWTPLQPRCRQPGNNPYCTPSPKAIYRPESCRLDYALVKRSGKQFHRSLQTADRQLAVCPLTEFPEESRRLEPAKEGSPMTPGELADRWISLVRGHMGR